MTPAMPTRSLRASSPPTVSLEQQILMMEVNRELNRGNPRMPPLPPTPLTPALQPTTPSAGASAVGN